MIAARWIAAFGTLAAIVAVYRLWLHVNPTTVALTLLLLILALAANWGLRYAVILSVAASCCYNFYFLPPLGTFTISDPQNWLALFAFLVTAIIASRLSERARRDAADARLRQTELELLFSFSRELLQSENLASLLSSVPITVKTVTAATSSIFYLLEGDRLYQIGVDGVSEIAIPRLRKLALSLQCARADGIEMQLPIRSGVRPRGVLIMRDITLSIETAEALSRLISISIDRAQALESVARTEAAKESERLRTLMIDSITHELRTPLTSIKGAATTLLAGQIAADENHELLSIIDEECDRLNRLVYEAVEMAQLDAHQVQMRFSPVDVRELIQDACEACAWVEEQHPVSVDLPDGLEVRADPAVLEKVICNLLENAAKYSKRGAPIIITAGIESERVVISVVDQGVGIDPAEQTLIFERFYRGRTQGVSGTGMGLAISRAIVEAHEGTITVASQPGKGSAFTITLPAAAS